MSHLGKFDYVTINDNFDKALLELKAIIQGKPEAFKLKTESQILNHKSLIEKLK